jgi:hypothetical protein
MAFKNDCTSDEIINQYSITNDGMFLNCLRATLLNFLNLHALQRH